MLPDFPRLKEELQEKFLKSIQNEIRKDPILSQIKMSPIYEGNKLSVSTIDGYTQTSDYPKISSKFGAKHEEVIEKGPEVMFSKVHEIAQDIIKQQSRNLFKKMHEITEITGNALDAKQPLSPELVLEALKQISIDFDNTGNPIYPLLIVPPNQFEKIKNWQIDPEFRRKHQEIIEQKRKEWIDRENRRKLVD